MANNKYTLCSLQFNKFYAANVMYLCQTCYLPRSDSTSAFMGPVCSTSVSHLPQLRNVSWKRTGTIKVTDKEGNKRFMKSHEFEKTRSRKKEGRWRKEDEQGWQGRREIELIKREKITKDKIKMKGEEWCTRRKASIIRRGRQTGTKERKMIFIFL